MTLNSQLKHCNLEELILRKYNISEEIRTITQYINTLTPDIDNESYMKAEFSREYKRIYLGDINKEIARKELTSLTTKEFLKKYEID